MVIPPPDSSIVRGPATWRSARKPSSSSLLDRTWPLPVRGWTDLQSCLRQKHIQRESCVRILVRRGTVTCPKGCLALNLIFSEATVTDSTRFHSHCPFDLLWMATYLFCPVLHNSFSQRIVPQIYVLLHYNPYREWNILISGKKVDFLFFKHCKSGNGKLPRL